MAKKSSYRDKQERGLVPSRYPTNAQMRGAWQHWPPSVRSPKDMADCGKSDLPRRQPYGHTFIEPRRQMY